MEAIGVKIGITFTVNLVIGLALAGYIGISELFILTGVLSLLALFVICFISPSRPYFFNFHSDAEANMTRYILIKR